MKQRTLASFSPPSPIISSSDSNPLLLLSAVVAAAAATLSIFKPSPPRSLCRRRLILPMNSPVHSPEPLTFSSPDSLSSWLRPRLPPSALDSWGVSPGSKTLYNLFRELSLGESSLLPQDHPAPPLRCVHVATVKIYNQRGAILVESHQLLSDGTVRTRGRPPSEKMLPGESVEEAAVRAVREEIGGMEVKIRAGTYKIRVEERVSASYPGLPARYVLHSVEAEVVGLPEEGEFSTEETGECDEDGNGVAGKTLCVRRHFWKWVDYDDASLDFGA
ncbi:hypothetical protein J5N97_019004 [Dioscorea zingiberensis]|uniref:Nudix hydrolase domain-containing protein n=1 Tax=Dioscorea zingiberensis TaxID=325984 RepID=A0A9D5CDX2_9LILI|nr:hypothetical protein J5N97_019004 [Dioscorea zingiberensis]